MKTSSDKVEIYNRAAHVFTALQEEVRALARKKPDAVLSRAKVEMINKLLNDLLVMLKDEPDSGYLAVLNDDELPSYSDASFMLSQFSACVIAFKNRYNVASSEFLGNSEFFGATWAIDEQD